MNKKKKPTFEKNPGKAKEPQKIVTGFDRLEEFLKRNRKIIYYSLCFFTLLFSFLLFDIRISEGGDDSTYVFGGYKYSKDFFHYFFTYNAPLWPMFLGIMIKMAGLKLVFLKFTSVLFYFFSFILFYKTFEKRIPYFLLIPAVFFYAINSHLQYFASQTYNESFFLFFQSLLIYAFAKLLDRLKAQNGVNVFKNNWLQWILVGILMTVLSLAKNLGIVIFPIVILFFLFQKQWKNVFIVTITSVGARISYEVIKHLIWGSLSQFATQSSMFLRKDPYVESSGTEDVSGFLVRFVENTLGYFSNRIPQIFGFFPATYEDYSVVMTLSILFLLIFAFIRIWKSRDQLLLFLSLYIGGSLAVSFVILHAIWAQERLIVIFIPMFLILICFALHKLISKYKWGYPFYMLFVLIISASFAISTVRSADRNIGTLKKNLNGDLFYGYTPDWAHFLKMSKWCADNLPPNAIVASRKASMSFIYGNGKEFFPVNHNLFYDTLKKECNPDSVLLYCKKNNVKYFMVANLRFFSDRKSDQIINTMQVVFGPLAIRNPEKIILVHSEGERDDEPCYLYEIKY